MSLVWLPPRSIRNGSEDLYKQVQHWLIDDDGRILAVVCEPQRDNPDDSFDAHLKFESREYAGFISADHAKAWAERNATEHLAKQKKAAEAPAAEGVVEAVGQPKE